MAKHTPGVFITKDGDRETVQAHCSCGWFGDPPVRSTPDAVQEAHGEAREHEVAARTGG